MLLWQMVARYGWFDLAFGSFSPLFGIAAVTWMICIWVAIRRRRRWWVLATAPLMLYPVYAAGTLLIACHAGDCV